METLETDFSPKLFFCDVCTITCKRQCEWERHIKTKKHIGNKMETNGNQNFTAGLSCDCGKKYSNRSGLWKHKQKCTSNEETSLIVQLMKQNDDFKNLLLEQNKTIIEQNNKVFESHNQLIELCKHNASSITNSTVNSNNKTFNLQVFLNEDCKDAMNINEFVESIKFQLADLEHMGQVGYVEGISNIIIKNMKALDITKRPVHCTDQKRETIYIKDEGVWIKEDEDNKNVRKLIKRVAFRNSKCIRLFKEKHPDCVTSESKYSDTYNKIVMEAMGGGPKCNDYDSESKIIKKLAKIVTIDKSTF